MAAAGGGTSQAMRGWPGGNAAPPGGEVPVPVPDCLLELVEAGRENKRARQREAAWWALSLAGSRRVVHQLTAKQRGRGEI